LPVNGLADRNSSSVVAIRSPVKDSAAHRFLRSAATALRPFLQPSGELFDPVWGEPTEYGTVYYAYVNAVLALLSEGGERDDLLDAAYRGVRVAVAHVGDLSSPTPAAAFTRDVGTPETLNLRDFMWPPVLRTALILRELGHPGAKDVLTAVSRVAVPEVFHKRPPVNWASVWISGEWLRIVARLSPHTIADIDAWVEPFFAQIESGLGFYREPGHANSYDLFTRVHLLHLLEDGYDGQARERLEALLERGLRRSLDVQLSTGSLATAHRSSAHLWNLLAEVSYFHGAARLLRQTRAELAHEADEAAQRAFGAAEACVRPAGDVSPVENVLPANHRVGYEVYTMEAHYVSLALGFLATALLRGFTAEGPAPHDSDEPRVLIENAPVHRHVLHRSGWSVHVNVNPLTGYQSNDPFGLRPDAFGIADITLGFGRRLRFGGQTKNLSMRTPLTVGVALHRPDTTVSPLSAATPLRNWPAHWDGRFFTVEADIEGDLRYRLAIEIDGDALSVREGVEGQRASLLVPYLRDRGDGAVTAAEIADRSVTLRLHDEVVRVELDAEVTRAVHLPHGYESRHGLVGLVRFDLAAAGPVAYRVARVA
jgi:hypothetical protein